MHYGGFDSPRWNVSPAIIVFHCFISLDLTAKKVRQKKYDELTKFEKELRAECVANIVMPNSFIALFSPTESFVFFYLCQAFSIETASEMMNDQYNHVIQQGDKYIYHTGWPVIFKNKIPGFSRFFSWFLDDFSRCFAAFSRPFHKYTRDF